MLGKLTLILGDKPLPLWLTSWPASRLWPAEVQPVKQNPFEECLLLISCDLTFTVSPFLREVVQKVM